MKKANCWNLLHCKILQNVMLHFQLLDTEETAGPSHSPQTHCTQRFEVPSSSVRETGTPASAKRAGSRKVEGQRGNSEMANVPFSIMIIIIC